MLLIIDSVTRYAMALREIGLAAGAPPTLRAYTPNVFSALPRLVERCGAVNTGGAITALMTVLSETDDNDDPISETMRSLLDGHIVLSRELAERGHFPAIDILRSISRQSEHLVAPEHLQLAQKILGALSIYDESKVMIESGIYKSGSQTALDQAIAARKAFLPFLLQKQTEHSTLEQTLSQMQALLGGGIINA